MKDFGGTNWVELYKWDSLHQSFEIKVVLISIHFVAFSLALRQSFPSELMKSKAFIKQYDHLLVIDGQNYDRYISLNYGDDIDIMAGTVAIREHGGLY